jgi:hypothetical protein
MCWLAWTTLLYSCDAVMLAGKVMLHFLGHSSVERAVDVAVKGGSCD